MDRPTAFACCCCCCCSDANRCISSCIQFRSGITSRTSTLRTKFCSIVIVLVLLLLLLLLAVVGSFQSLQHPQPGCPAAASRHQITTTCRKASFKFQMIGDWVSVLPMLHENALRVFLAGKNKRNGEKDASQALALTEKVPLII